MNDANLFASALRSKRAGLVIALISLLLIVGAPPSEMASQSTTSPENLHMRARVGHFAHYTVSDPLANIYQLYFDNVLKKSDSSLSSLDINDWRRARPSGSVCLDYLMQLRVHKLTLVMPFDIVIMDACLDWLFGDDKYSDRSTDEQKFSNTQKRNFNILKQSSDLKAIYTSTMFAEQKVPERLKDELYEYLKTLLEIHGSDPRKGCHGEWLESYMNFIENLYLEGCDSLDDCTLYGLESAKDDSYLRMIADSTIHATKACYSTMLRYIGQTLKKAKEEHITTSSFAKRLVKSAVMKQQEQEKWTEEMTRVLQIAQGVDKNTRVELDQVAVQLEKIKDDDEEATEKFTEEVANYATENTNKEDSDGDFNGRKRYALAMVKLCKPFVDYDKFLADTGGFNTDDQKTAKPFDFYKIVYSLVRVTNHEELLGISGKQFEEDVIKNNWEAVYLATFACHVIFNTWGVLGSGQNDLEYVVALNKEALSMLAIWPIEVMSQELAINNQKSSSTSVFDIRPKKPRFLRTRFSPRLMKRNEQKQQDQAQDSSQALAQASAQVSAQASAQASAKALAQALARVNGHDSEDATPTPTEVLDKQTLAGFFFLHRRFPMDTNDQYFIKYPLLVNCLPKKMQDQYEEYHSFGKDAFKMKIPVSPDCEF